MADIHVLFEREINVRLPALQKLLDPANGEKTYEDDH